MLTSPLEIDLATENSFRGGRGKCLSCPVPPENAKESEVLIQLPLNRAFPPKPHTDHGRFIFKPIRIQMWGKGMLNSCGIPK